MRKGRLVLSDAVSYGIKDEKITKILDIATLTGAVWSALGYTIAGSMSDDDHFMDCSKKGLSIPLKNIFVSHLDGNTGR